MLGQEMASIVIELAEQEASKDASRQMSLEYRAQTPRLVFRRYSRIRLVYRSVEILFGIAIAVAIFGPFFY